MQRFAGLFLIIGLMAATVFGAWLVSHPPPPKPFILLPNMVPPPAEPAAPEPEPPAPDSLGPDAQAPAAPDVAAAPADAAAAPNALPALTEVKIAARPIHTVPEEAGPPPPSSQDLDQRSPPRPPPAAIGTIGATTASGLRAPRQFSGAAQATGAVDLQVDATAIQLYGIKRPDDRDRCGTDTAGDCGAAARQALAVRLGSGGKVSCRVPNPRPDAKVAAICLDPNGVDLSGFLIAQGLALADTRQSYDYVGAEGVARNLKRGLWQFR
jgi:endonuclease YncB( thermonuclease family)